MNERERKMIGQQLQWEYESAESNLLDGFERLAARLRDMADVVDGEASYLPNCASYTDRTSELVAVLFNGFNNLRLDSVVSRAGRAERAKVSLGEFQDGAQ